MSRNDCAICRKKDEKARYAQIWLDLAKKAMVVGVDRLQGRAGPPSFVKFSRRTKRVNRIRRRNFARTPVQPGFPTTATIVGRPDTGPQQATDDPGEARQAAFLAESKSMLAARGWRVHVIVQLTCPRLLRGLFSRLACRTALLCGVGFTLLLVLLLLGGWSWNRAGRVEDISLLIMELDVFRVLANTSHSAAPVATFGRGEASIEDDLIDDTPGRAPVSQPAAEPGPRPNPMQHGRAKQAAPEKIGKSADHPRPGRKAKKRRDGKQPARPVLAHNSEDPGNVAPPMAIEAEVQ
jgi:hypothetical protein